MLFGILCLVTTGIIWVIPGAIVSHSAKKGLSLDFIQGMAGAVFIFLAVPVYLLGSTRFPLITWLVLPASGILNYLCFSAAGKAMKKGPSGLTWAMMFFVLNLFFYVNFLFQFSECMFTSLTANSLRVERGLIIYCIYNL